MSDRYVVRSTTGYTIRPENSNSGSQQRMTTSYLVLDSAYCYREVASFSRRRWGQGSDDKFRAQAEDLCAQLNAEDGAEEAGLA